jgi:hypothetical protein
MISVRMVFVFLRSYRVHISGLYWALPEVMAFKISHSPKVFDGLPTA